MSTTTTTKKFSFKNGVMNIIYEKMLVPPLCEKTTGKCVPLKALNSVLIYCNCVEENMELNFIYIITRLPVK